MKNVLRTTIALSFILFAGVAMPAWAQAIPANAFGLHIRCTPSETNQNPDCKTPTSWPHISQAPDPANPFGSLRFHDNGAKWGNIQLKKTPDCNGSATSGCAWGAFDEWIRQARRHKVELLYTFSKTPEWACAKGHGCASSDVPADSAFLNFVKAVRDRPVDGRRAGCKTGDASDSGCIRFWEVWNEPNNGKSAWCGSIGDMVHLARLVRDTVTTTDEEAKVVSPGVGYTAGYNGSSCTAAGISGEGVCSHWGRGNGNAEAYICEFLRQKGSGDDDRAGRDYVDFVGWHPYPSNSNLQNLAEDAITRRLPNVQTAMRDNKLSVCAPGRTSGCNQLWITETSWGNVSQKSHNGNELGDSDCDSPNGCPRINPVNDNRLPDCSTDKPKDKPGCWSHDQSAYLAKLYLLSLSSGVNRVFWYWWDGQPWGTLFCKSPNPIAGCSERSASAPYLQQAATAYGAIQKWLVGRTMDPCAQAGDSTWSCMLRDDSGRASKIVWSPSGPRKYSPGPFNKATDIYGHTQSISASANIGYSPVLLQKN